MNLKIATIGVIVVILAGTAVYLSMNSKVSQPVQKITQQPEPISEPTEQESNQIFLTPSTEIKIIAINNKTGECKEFQSANDISSEWMTIEEFKSCEEVAIRKLNAQRISAISTIRAALEIYYADNQNYPQNLSLLLPKYFSKNESLTDPETKKEYYYIQFNKGKDYHLGAKLNEKDILAMNTLKMDADFDSTGFNGFDGKDPIYDRTSLR